MRVKHAFLERFGKEREPQNVIREANDAIRDQADLKPSLQWLANLYRRAGFNDEDTFGFLTVAVIKILLMGSFAMYGGISTYGQLIQATTDLECRERAF